MTKHKVTLLILLNFNTKKYILLLILYNQVNTFFLKNNLLLKVLHIFINKFRKSIEQYRITNNSLLISKWLTFSRIDLFKHSIDKLNLTNRFNYTFFSNYSFTKLTKITNGLLNTSMSDIVNLLIYIGFTKQNIIFLTHPYLTDESYLLNLHCLGVTESKRLNVKLKHFLFLNKHDKLSNMANFCFLLNPAEVNYKYLSYYRNRYVPIVGVSTTQDLNVIYDKTIYSPHISESSVYTFMSFIMVNYLTGRNLSMYYNSQVYYTQVIFFIYRRLNLYKKII